MLGTEVVSDVILQTKVEKMAEASATPATFKTILAIIFAILVVVLIVLGIVIAVRKTAEAEEETPGTAEGQTYYYSPKK